MKTKILKANKAGLHAATIAIKKGQVVVFPTETVYGIGASVLHKGAIRKVFKAKERPSDNPLIVHIASYAQLDLIAKDISGKAKKVMQKFWPGPLTLILHKTKSVPSIVTANLRTVAVRMPNYVFAKKLINATGPIAAPSANISGRPSGTQAGHVIEDLQGKVDVIVDGGKSKIGIESTVIDMTVDPPVILRPGHVTQENLQKVIGKVITSAKHKIVKSPGMKYRHYAPKAKVILVIGKDKKQIIKGLLTKNCAVISLKSKFNVTNFVSHNLKHFGQHLFYNFRECDKLGITTIIVEGVDEKELGRAIMNRVRKAASEIIV